MVDRYQHIVVGDVSSLKLVKTRMAKSVLDSGWGMLKRFLAYKCEHAARSFEVRDERYTTVTCSNCGSPEWSARSQWADCKILGMRDCGQSHDRDVNAARNILIGSRCRTSVRGNELSYSLIPPSNAYRVREAGMESARAAA
jgi:putative transposase